MVWGKGASASPHTIIRPICTSVLSCHGELTVAVWLPIHTACPHVKCNISLMPSYVEDRQLHLFKSLRKVKPYGRYVIYFLKGLSFIPICFICKFQGFGVFWGEECFCSAHVLFPLVVNGILLWLIKTCSLNLQQDILDINWCNAELTARGSKTHVEQNHPSTKKKELTGEKKENEEKPHFSSVT